MILVSDVLVCSKSLLVSKAHCVSRKRGSKWATTRFLLPNDQKIMQQQKRSKTCCWKENTKPGRETATFFRSIKLCAYDKLFWTTENTNSKVENQKTTFDRLEHSAISDRLHFYLRGCNIGSKRWRRGILKFFVFPSRTSFSSKLFVSHN